MSTGNPAASIRARLLNQSKESNTDFMQVLTRYALERMLYRLDQSRYRDQFLLKGALLFDLWFDVPHRPTRDADLLGFGASDMDTLAAIFREICALPAEDGIHFDTAGVRVQEIREDNRYGGARITLTGTLDGARCPVQIDIGYGDAVTPEPEEAHYPTLLPGMPAPCLRTYPRYTVVAEKCEIMVAFGMANSRMKDYFDLWLLARRMDFDGATLSRAITATFTRRQTPWPGETPLGLSDTFAQDRAKAAQWQAFLRKNRLMAPGLSDVVSDLRMFLLPPLRAASGIDMLKSGWAPGGPWQ